MSPLTPLVQYLNLKTFVLWVVLPLAGTAVPLGLRRLAGVEHLAGKYFVLLQAENVSSAYLLF